MEEAVILLKWFSELSQPRVLQRASTTQREKSCIKDPQTFYVPSEDVARLHSSGDKVAFLDPCTFARINGGCKTARLGDSGGYVRASFPREGGGKVKVGKISNCCLHDMIPWWVSSLMKCCWSTGSNRIIVRSNAMRLTSLWSNDHHCHWATGYNLALAEHCETKC